MRSAASGLRQQAASQSRRSQLAGRSRCAMPLYGRMLVVKPIAVFANERLKALPDVPTFKEKGSLETSRSPFDR